MKVLWRICYRWNVILARRARLRAWDHARTGDHVRAMRQRSFAALFETRAEKFCALIKGRA